jgi:hypothetical protein
MFRYDNDYYFIKSKKKIADCTICALFNIINLFNDKLNKNFPKTFSSLVQLITDEFFRICFCGYCNQHIFNIDLDKKYKKEELKELNCPNCGLLCFKEKKNRKKQLKLEPTNFIYHFPLAQLIINKLLNTNFIDILDYKKYSGIYFETIKKNYEKKIKNLVNLIPILVKKIKKIKKIKKLKKIKK